VEHHQTAKTIDAALEPLQARAVRLARETDDKPAT
jgi:hypothetical protein